MATKNIVPRANDEGGIGTAAKNWLVGRFKELVVGTTGITSGGNIKIPDAGNIGSASDTDAIAISAAGVLTFSGQSGCSVKLTNDQVVEPDKSIALMFDTELWDTQNEFNSTVTTGTADATEANKLHDADGGFDASMVGATVWNTTDNTYTTVSAFVDAGELTLADNIMVNGEGYKIYWCKFTCTVAGKYIISGTGSVLSLGDGEQLQFFFYKNGAGFGAWSRIAAGADGNAAASISAEMDLAANDYVQFGIFHDSTAARTAKAYDFSNNLSISKIE